MKKYTPNAADVFQSYCLNLLSPLLKKAQTAIKKLNAAQNAIMPKIIVMVIPLLRLIFACILIVEVCLVKIIHG